MKDFGGRTFDSQAPEERRRTRQTPSDGNIINLKSNQKQQCSKRRKINLN